MIPGQAFDQLARLDDLFGVEAGGRLIKNQHVGVVHQRLRQADALPVAFRELSAAAVCHVGDARLLHHLVDARLATGPRDPLDARDKRQVLAHRHFGIERRCFGKVAGPPLRLDRLLKYVVSRDNRLSLARRNVAGEHPHRRRLARAVRSEEAENLAPLDGKADVVHRGYGAVPLGEMLNFDHRNASACVIRLWISK